MKYIVEPTYTAIPAVYGLSHPHQADLHRGNSSEPVRIACNDLRPRTTNRTRFKNRVTTRTAKR